MPELPEVETTCRGIEKFIVYQKIKDIIVRQDQLRWRIPTEALKKLIGKEILAVNRRAKYILISTEKITVIIHLGMSGHLQILQKDKEPQKHDHVDIIFQNNTIMRYTDPRRFGAILCAPDNPLDHPILKKLGIEPLSEQFTAEFLFKQSRKRQVPIKQFLMNHQIVVGVGNIYANEALFHARISPLLKASQLTLRQCDKLVASIKYILENAIRAGGTTLKNFLSSEGKPGFFVQELLVYGREELPCAQCKKPIKKIVLGQRSTFYCEKCQPLKSSLSSTGT